MERTTATLPVSWYITEETVRSQFAPGKGNPPAEVAHAAVGVEFVYSDMSGAFREMDRQRIEILLK